MNAAAGDSQTRKPPKNIDRLVAVWKRAFVLAKKIEPKVEAARAAVVQLLVDAGVPVGDKIETKHGSLSLQTKTTTDWEGLARSVIATDKLEELVPKFTKTSAPFTRAPSSWAGEARGA